jgi:hypothetical protein
MTTPEIDNTSIDSLDSQPAANTTPKIDFITQIREKETSTTLRDVMTLLQFLAKLEPNQKIIFSVPCVVEHNSLVGNLLRRYHKETRETNLEQLYKLMAQVCDLLKLQLSDEQRAHLITDVNGALKGIGSLAVTYNHDRLYCAKITVFLRDAQVDLKKAGATLSYL